MHDGLRKIVLRDAGSSNWLSFGRAKSLHAAFRLSEVAQVLDTVQRGVDSGLYAAGYISYEAAGAFDSALSTLPPGRMPLLCFGLFDEPERSGELLPGASSPTQPISWRHATDRETYARRIASIKEQIELGNCYQINYTLRASAKFSEEPWDLFCDIAADARYAAFLDFGDTAIISASPELFFSLDGNRIVCCPMKGTARRGMTTRSDRDIAHALQLSAKNRAENVMITDMLRNDLGRIALPGSVHVDSLYDLEKLATVWQMTSTVSAWTIAEPVEILRALFPCASVTGAPKASAMRIIAALEDSPREVYTGAIGYLAPGRRAQFSVAIRTAWIDRENGTATFGTGSGVVWDSDAGEEYDECLAKSGVLRSRAGDRNFELLETMLWTPGDGYFLLELHIERMRDSANYFGFPFEEAMIRERLGLLEQTPGSRRKKVRMRLGRDGSLQTDCHELDDAPKQSLRIGLATVPVETNDPFLYHKTTRRDVYDHACSGAPEGNEVLLWNRDGYVTESATANVIVEIDGSRYTPPVECGLLGGTYRRMLLERGEIIERRIHVHELPDIGRISLINSVRGEYAVSFVDDTRKRDTAASI